MTGAKEKKCMRLIAAYLVEQLMKLKECSRDEALEILMTTTVYEALMDPDTGLYTESRESVFDILKEELDGNPYRLMAM